MSIYTYAWNNMMAQNLLRGMKRDEVLARFHEPLATLVERGGESDMDFVRYRTEPKRNLILTVWFKGDRVARSDIEADFPDGSQASIVSVEGVEGPVIAREPAQHKAAGVAGVEVKVLRPARIPDDQVWFIRHADPCKPTQWEQACATTEEIRHLLGIGDRLVQILKGPFSTVEEGNAVCQIGREEVYNP